MSKMGWVTPVGLLLCLWNLVVLLENSMKPKVEKSRVGLRGRESKSDV